MYSLWFVPTQKVDDRTSLLISELAAEYNSPAFRPHVTVVGGLTEDPTNKVQGLVKNLKPFEITLTTAQYLDEYFRCVFYEVAPNRTLMDINKKAQKLFEHEDMYYPHLSILYGNHDEELRKQIAEEIGEMNQSFIAKKIVIVKGPSNPDPKSIAQWKIVGEARF